jgi:hypothetical protein
MTARQLEQIVEGMAAAFALEKARLLLEFERIKNEMSGRLAELRDGDRGERGEPGEKGDKGDAGEKGDQGQQGQQGQQGPAGQTGERGEPGTPGERGSPGERGEPGERGAEGPRGSFVPPDAWIEGVHYQGELTFLDGSTWCARCDTAQRPPGADWAPVALAGLDGRTGDAKGLYDPSAAYSKLDRVSLNGSEWIARRDDPGALPGDGWMLGAKVGPNGRPGERGPKGERGEQGIGVEGVTADGYALLVALTGGKTIRLDLRGMFDRYDQERRG